MRKILLSNMVLVFSSFNLCYGFAFNFYSLIVLKWVIDWEQSFVFHQTRKSKCDRDNKLIVALAAPSVNQGGHRTTLIFFF